MDHLCYLCLVFVIFSRLFIVALWSSFGKGLISWLLFVMFNCALSLSHVVSWVRCGTSIPDLCRFSYLVEELDLVYAYTNRGGSLAVSPFGVLTYTYFYTVDRNIHH